jgi:hypothetical protein
MAHRPPSLRVDLGTIRGEQAMIGGDAPMGEAEQRRALGSTPLLVPLVMVGIGLVGNDDA